eukprot:SAG25_NODE_55_length_18625_cov_548.233726_4_plen_65_part_00
MSGPSKPVTFEYGTSTMATSFALVDAPAALACRGDVRCLCAMHTKPKHDDRWIPHGSANEPDDR